MGKDALWEIEGQNNIAEFVDSRQRVAAVAPILKKLIPVGTSLRDVWSLCDRKGWKCTITDGSVSLSDYTSGRPLKVLRKQTHESTAHSPTEQTHAGITR